VELAEHLRKTYGSTIHAEIFENHRGEEAHREILRLVGASNGAMTEAAKRAARIVLYGHSWGASEAVAMARQLERDGVPVLLVVQVDGVPKLGENDGVIPANVAQAVNYYQLDGLLHGRRKIRAADPAATTILGNFRLTYKDGGVACPGYPWYTRAFTKPHIEIENDPRVWNKVEALILSKATP
jgi:pimeloyl-ACP methyl ester carboxylesterase